MSQIAEDAPYKVADGGPHSTSGLVVPMVTAMMLKRDNATVHFTLFCHTPLVDDICDVICEKGPYCGRNSVFLDQLFLHVCDSIFYQNCAGSEKNVSFRCSFAKTCSYISIRSLFADDVTYTCTVVTRLPNIELIFLQRPAVTFQSQLFTQSIS